MELVPELPFGALDPGSKIFSSLGYRGASQTCHALTDCMSPWAAMRLCMYSAVPLLGTVLYNAHDLSGCSAPQTNVRELVLSGLVSRTVPTRLDGIFVHTTLAGSILDPGRLLLADLLGYAGCILHSV